MQISYHHLLEHFTDTIAVDNIHQVLNQMGAEVEKVEQKGNDSIFHLEITPNRPDLLSYQGLAREISAGLEKPTLLKPLKTTIYPNDQSDVHVVVKLKNFEDCPRYFLRKITNITPKTSPMPWQTMLTKSGFSLFNHVVDAINLKMVAFGQPMHAIDADKIVGHIVVRNAKPNESILCLDGKTRVLTEDDIVISDEADNPVAIGGVIGAKYAEVTENTRNILLECAYFNPQTVRKTCKRLNTTTESSHRFEMGVDPHGLEYGLNVVTEALLSINGQLAGTAIYNANTYQATPKQVTLSIARLKIYFSFVPEQAWIKQSLQSLGFDVLKLTDEEIIAQIPSWRTSDVKYDVCLIEELAKIYDYNKLPSFPPQAQISLRPKNRWLQFKRRSEEFFVHQGYYSVLNFGFISEEDIAGFNPAKDSTLLNYVFIERPLNQNFTILRNTQLPGLIHNFNANIDRQEEQIQLFEIGRIFFIDKEQSIREQRAISGLMYGPNKIHNWLEPTHIHTIYDLKSLVNAYLTTTTRHHAEDFEYRQTSIEYFVPKHGCDIYYQNIWIGRMGQLQHQKIHKKAIHPVFGFELDLDKLIAIGNHDTTVYRAPSRFPSIHKDFAFIADEGFCSQNIISVIRSIGKDLIKSIYLFDVYQGKPIPKGKESLAYKIEFNSKERSLTHEEVNDMFDAMIKTLTNNYPLQLRDS